MELVIGVTDSDCTIAKAAASLLHGLGQRNVDLRRAFGFDIPATAGDHNSASSFPDLHVKSLLSILFHFSRVSGQVGSPFYTTLQYLAKNSLQLLSYLICHSCEWTTQFQDQSINVALSNGFDSLTCPPFLPFILRYGERSYLKTPVRVYAIFFITGYRDGKPMKLRLRNLTYHISIGKL